MGSHRSQTEAAAPSGIGTPEPGAQVGPSDEGSARRPACFHCGEPCPDARHTKDDRTFCCSGCLVVHELLTESGLGHFYDLGPAPGVRVKPGATSARWVYLDDPALQQRLLDFTDGKLSRVTFRIPSMHCVACVWLLENLFRLHPGIHRSQVDFPRRQVTIGFAADRIRLSELVALLVSIGYEPELTLGELDPRQADLARRRRWLQVGIAGFGFGNIMLISLPLYLGLDSLSGPLFRVVFGYLSLALALPVLAYSASDYWKSAWLALRQRVLTLDVPIALGLAALYGQSVFEIASGRGEGYLDSLTGLVFFLLCGRAFQQRTYERLAFDRDFKSFFPLAVMRKSDSGEAAVALSNVRVGDRLVIRNGELIPADARLLSGPACIDYSFVTGEAEPVRKSVGDYLYAGGRQTGGALEVETVKPVSQGYLTSLWNHEAFRKDREGGLDTLTNRYSRRFTLLVIGVAVGGAAFWLGSGDAARALKAFISVLIVACPCALALAAPFALGTAQRILARFNVYLRNAHIVERLAQTDTIVFDKTGTLTFAGGATVTFAPAARRAKATRAGPGPEPRGNAEPGLDPAETGWVRSLARQSTHPYSGQIGEALAGRGEALAVDGFSETPGGGIEGRVAGHEIRLGSAKWLASGGLALEPEPSVSAPSDPPGAGPTPTSGSVVGLAVDGEYRGAFVLSTRLRPDTDRLLRRLSGRYQIALLSGDHERERERFRQLFGDGARLLFGQSPLDKLGFIRRLQESGRTVLMVGDGLNDAGALRQSDVGVAVVERVGAFSPASDIILEAGQVSRLFEVLTLARRAVSVVRWSFVISALYNVVGIGIATAGWLSPVICAILMPLSSVSVVTFACGATTWAARRERLVS